MGWYSLFKSASGAKGAWWIDPDGESANSTTEDHDKLMEEGWARVTSSDNELCVAAKKPLSSSQADAVEDIVHHADVKKVYIELPCFEGTMSGDDIWRLHKYLTGRRRKTFGPKED